MHRGFVVTCLLIILTTTGTIGFRLLSGLPWVECVYLAVVTLTTVGSRELPNLTHGGMIFVIVYLVSGIGVFTFSAFELGQWVINAQFGSLFEKRRMAKDISNLNDHYIVCGQGRMGMIICKHLHDRRKPFVVIENEEDRAAQRCRQHGWLHISGDATSDDVLQEAGIERARSLTTVVSTDADNLYVVLSARMLNSQIPIIARANNEKAIQKMERAGASRVVSPFNSGAVKIARFMLNPSIEDFLEIADSRWSELTLADIQIKADSPYAGKQLIATDLRDKGIMVIGISRANGDRLIPPSGTDHIQPGDCLFAFGAADAINEMVGDTERVD